VVRSPSPRTTWGPPGVDCSSPSNAATRESEMRRPCQRLWAGAAGATFNRREPRRTDALSKLTVGLCRRKTKIDGYFLFAGVSMTDAESVAPKNRFCDLVMKGGITSGVVYPPAIFALAGQYRFKNIGGTSAGAIAAAITAAAEFQRRVTGSMDGFRRVEQLPDALGTTDGSGNTQLLRLFQPDRPCRRPFRILIGSLNAGGTFRRIGKVILSCLTSYWLATMFSLIASLLVWWQWQSPHAAAFTLVLTLPSFIGLLLYFDLTRAVVGNGYGLCKGMTTTPKAGPALTPWLHARIQEAAGLALDQPLTFGDLWDAPGAPPTQPNNATGARSIDLRMFTTNLSHGRPYIFPHTESTARLFYQHDELAPYLPPEVMRWIDDHGLEYAPNPGSPGSDPTVEKAMKLGLREIPPPGSFPVLLAARMSLSFPVLFAAVPLWAIDYEDPRPERDFRRCLFSDGGISSNFPIHLFDGLAPNWPTFGINLEDKLEGHPNMTFLPQHYLDGIADRWTRFDQAKKSASKMGGFLISIVSAMQNWNDNMLSRMPGVRDRVVRVRLNKKEGGMNLNMEKDLITEVAKRGGTAAQELITKFLGPAPPSGWDGWSSQRWIRRDVLVRALSEKVSGLEQALGPSVPYSKSYSSLTTLATSSAPPGHRAPLTPPQAAALTLLTAALDAVTTAFSASSSQYSNDPLPEPDFRVRPPL